MNLIPALAVALPLAIFKLASDLAFIQDQYMCLKEEHE